MTAKEFEYWRRCMGWNRSETARRLGLGRNAPERYETGKAVIPLHVEYACLYLRDMAERD